MEPYERIPRHYDLEHDDFEDDIPFLRRYTVDGPVLEVGVGTGRVLEGLLDLGHDLWGVDPSEPMLERARDRLGDFPSVHLVLGSAADLPIDVRFGTVLLTLNLLWHVTETDDRLAMLEAVRLRCKPGARLVADLSNPFTLADRGARGTVRERFRRETDDGEVRGWSSCWDDEAEQRLYLSIVYDETDADALLRRTSTDLELRYLYRGELELLLRLAGFDVEDVVGDYGGEPYTAQSPNLIAVARLAAR